MMNMGMPTHGRSYDFGESSGGGSWKATCFAQLLFCGGESSLSLGSFRKLSAGPILRRSKMKGSLLWCLWKRWAKNKGATFCSTTVSVFMVFASGKIKHHKPLIILIFFWVIKGKGFCKTNIIWIGIMT